MKRVRNLKRNMSYQRFKSDYVLFEKELNSFNEKDSAELSKALDVFINSFDDGEYVFKERDIENSQHLTSIYIKKDECFCYFNKRENTLNVVMKFPCFERLSRGATKNRNIQERLDYLGFLISRYVTRAFMLNIVLSLSLAKGEYYSFFGDYGHYHYFENKKSADQYFERFFTEISRSDEADIELSSEVRDYSELVNCFDPFVNRIAFYFLQFKYYEQLEDISICCLNFDNMIHSIILYLRKRKPKCFCGNNKRKDTVQVMFQLLSVNDKEMQRVIMSVYNIRCHLVAHASDADWWDFSDMFEDFFEEMKIQIRRIMVLLLEFDSKNRKEIFPMKSWSQWVKENISDVFDSNFFNLYEKIFGKNLENLNA